MPLLDRSAFHRNNIKEFAEYKKTLRCLDCGLQDHRVLQFHHRDPKDIHRLPSGKRVPLSSLVRSGNITAAKKYVDCCDVLCANCHLIRHRDDQN